MTLSLFEMLRAAFDREALGHALLFVVPGGIDAKLEGEFRRFRAMLMCSGRKTGEGPCGKCESCLILLSDNPDALHPDLVTLRGDPEKSNYGVDDVRALLEAFSLTRSLGTHRVAWISEADRLSAGGQTGAANALLKILEEPRPKSFLVLVTERPEALLPTIRSRCQIFRLPRAVDAETTAAAKTLGEWQPLEDWLRAGAPPGRGPALPGDEDSFWKDREKAVTEIEEVYEVAWARLKSAWANLNRDDGKRALDTFFKLEACLWAIRGYGNAPLQWLQFRSGAKLDP